MVPPGSSLGPYARGRGDHHLDQGEIVEYVANRAINAEKVDQYLEDMRAGRYDRWKASGRTVIRAARTGSGTGGAGAWRSPLRGDRVALAGYLTEGLMKTFDIMPAPNAADVPGGRPGHLHRGPRLRADRVGER